MVCVYVCVWGGLCVGMGVNIITLWPHRNPTAMCSVCTVCMARLLYFLSNNALSGNSDAVHALLTCALSAHHATFMEAGEWNGLSAPK